MNTLGYRLLELLKAKDMTQKELAYTIGVSEVSISRYVNNARKPRTMVLYKMAEVLGVSAEYLLTGNKKEEYGKWIPVSERMPKICGLKVLLTVENGYGQKSVCTAFTNYYHEGKFMFLTNEKGYCEPRGSALIESWKPVAWMPLPKPYKE